MLKGPRYPRRGEAVHSRSAIPAVHRLTDLPATRRYAFRAATRTRARVAGPGSEPGLLLGEAEPAEVEGAAPAGLWGIARLAGLVPAAAGAATTHGDGGA